jgi:hypothetical protein
MILIYGEYNRQFYNVDITTVSIVLNFVFNQNRRFLISPSCNVLYQETSNLFIPPVCK